MDNYMESVTAAMRGMLWVNAGTRFPLCDPQGRRLEMHVVTVGHPNGAWEAVYCHTKEQADYICECVKYKQQHDPDPKN